MTGTEAVIRVDRASERDILSHLVEADGRFVPPLSHRVDLARYAEKIRARACTVEAWEGERLVGLVAAYVEGPDCFVTSVSVSPEVERRGLASRLMLALLAIAAERRVTTVTLEVAREAGPARRLYERLGFDIEERRGDLLLLRRQVREAAAPS